jgi:lipid II isoglutaminyl synthase (glutamine-hydrolysing)
LRDSVAVSVARTAGYWSRRRGHGGSSLPGLIAERIAPGVSGRLAAQLDAIAVVSGTNGKTTTTHLLDHVLQASGRNVITNRSGANLGQSVNTTVLDGVTQVSGERGTTAVLECDEFALADLTVLFQPDVLVLTNLFRDQLDRYTEIDEIERRWARLLRDLPNTTVVAPADDPRLAWLASQAPGGCLLYGVRTGANQSDEMGLTHDSEDCPVCGNPLAYDWHTIGHLGSYRCPACGFGRPSRWLDVEIVESHGFAGQTLRITSDAAPVGTLLRTSLPGTANAYNMAAAICTAFVLGVAPADAAVSLAEVSNAWGRFETAAIDGHRLILTLGKNPASIAELLRIAAASDIAGVLFVMNDGFQDGRDVSWYWDVNPALLARGLPCAISGARALDLSLRLKYDDRAGVDDYSPAAPRTFADPMAGLRWLLDATSLGATVLAISTYTGLVQLREALVARHVLERMPV